MLSTRQFLLLILAVGFLASLTAAAHSMVVEIVYSAATSPYNIGWNGTSKFISALEEKGYSVSIIEDLKDVRREEKLTLLIIAPETNYTSEEVEFLKKLMEETSLRLLIADENYITSSSIIKSLFGAELYRGLLATRVSESSYVFSQNITVEFEGETFKIVLNRPSAFKEVGEMEVIAYSNSTVYSSIVGLEGPPVFTQAEYPIVCVWSSNDDKAIVISDSSIFINLYFEGLEVSDNKRYALKLIDYLTDEDLNCRVYVDDSHYKLPSGEEAVVKVQSKVPIPPIGLMLGLMIAASVRYLDYVLDAILEYGIIPIQVLIIVLVAYTFFKHFSYLAGSKVDDEEPSRIDYLEVMAETPVFKRYSKGEGLTGKEYSKAVSTLYEILSKTLREELNISLDSAIEGLEPHKSRIKEFLGASYNRVVEVLKFMKRVRDTAAVKKRRLLPLTLAWRSSFDKCVKVSEEVLSRIGYSILGVRGRLLWRELWRE